MTIKSQSISVEDIESRLASYQNGPWVLDIALREHDAGERIYTGYSMILYDSNYSYAWGTIEILGLSASQGSPLDYNGNTPTGFYHGYLYGPYSSSYDKLRFGPHKVVSLTGVSGDIITSNRWGIMVHGGREGYSSQSDPWYPLYYTNGCVRISNDNQELLADNIEDLIYAGCDNMGYVNIFEW